MRLCLANQDKKKLAITMVLTDRNFNTSFFEVALRHSSFISYVGYLTFITLLVIKCFALYLYFTIDQLVNKLTRGALANEPGLLGLGIRANTGNCSVYNAPFASSVVNISSAKANNHFKTGPTNGFLLSSICNLLDRSYLTACTFKSGEIFCCVSLRSILCAIPEQVRTYIYTQRRKRIAKDLIHIISSSLSANDTYNGNLGKQSTHRHSIRGIHTNIIVICGILSFGAKLQTLFIANLRTAFKGLNGGKIIEQAKVEGNASNSEVTEQRLIIERGDNSLGINKAMHLTFVPIYKGNPHTCNSVTGLNSRWLNKASHCLVTIGSRSYITDAKHRQNPLGLPLKGEPLI